MGLTRTGLREEGLRRAPPRPSVATVGPLQDGIRATDCRPGTWSVDVDLLGDVDDAAAILADRVEAEERAGVRKRPGGRRLAACRNTGRMLVLSRSCTEGGGPSAFATCDVDAVIRQIAPGSVMRMTRGVGGRARRAGRRRRPSRHRARHGRRARGGSTGNGRRGPPGVSARGGSLFPARLSHRQIPERFARVGLVRRVLGPSAVHWNGASEPSEASVSAKTPARIIR